jgi:hypothetical protein
VKYPLLQVPGLMLLQPSNAGIVSDALKFVERKKERLDTLKKIDERIEESEEEKEKENLVCR